MYINERKKYIKLLKHEMFVNKGWLEHANKLITNKINNNSLNAAIHF